jgi:hypothetical protein
MPSKKRVEPLDTFETDVPITADDCQAQWQIRDGATMTSKQYLDWCTWLTRDETSHARDLHTEIFEL